MHKDDGAGLALVVIAAVCVSYCSGCSPPPTRTEIRPVAPIEILLDGGFDAGVSCPTPTEEEEPDAHAITVAEALRFRALNPYMSPHFRPICRRDSWRGDLELAETVLSKPEARVRARSLARAGALDELLIFARVLYGEEGPPTHENPDGAAAILAVIDYQRNRMSRVEMMVNYGPRRVFPHPGEGRRKTRSRWLAGTALNGRRPRAWRDELIVHNPGHPRWRFYGCPRWLSTIDWARDTLELYPETVGAGPCEEVPHHWGGDMDDHADDCHWRVVDCGVTEDTFWVVDEECREG